MLIYFSIAKNDFHVYTLCIAQSSYPINSRTLHTGTELEILVQVVLAHRQVSVTFLCILIYQVLCLHSSAHLRGVYNLYPEMSTDYLQFISWNVYRLSTVIHISHRAGKQNKFLTVKYTLPGTDTQVSTCNLLLSRYCISGNLETLSGETYIEFFICVYYYFC